MTQKQIKTDLPAFTATAIIVQPLFSKERQSRASKETADRIDEACGLARAIFLDVAEVAAPGVSRVNPGTLLGSGAVEEIAGRAEELSPDVIIVNHPLSPIQQRNLERAWSAKVIDRTGLILEIFGERAQTKEGRIQVELAALEYQSSRLVRSWTHLERQRGGAGFMGGPGETQIEIDRRMISEKIVKLKKDLEKIRKTRDLARKKRESVPYPVVALVGYTNAGKSTLFNTLTGADVFAENLLFATLDPTMRRMSIPGGLDVILADTVGFIADLPHHLVEAFRATLEQVEYADVILHVQDVSRPDHAAQKAEVEAILRDLGIEPQTHPGYIEVLNKTDLLDAETCTRLQNISARMPDQTVMLSAVKGQGLETLKGRISKIVMSEWRECIYRLPFHDGKAISWLHERAAEVVCAGGGHGAEDENEDESATVLHVRISHPDARRFESKFGYRDERS